MLLFVSLVCIAHFTSYEAKYQQLLTCTYESHDPSEVPISPRAAPTTETET